LIKKTLTREKVNKYAKNTMTYLQHLLKK